MIPRDHASFPSSLLVTADLQFIVRKGREEKLIVPDARRRRRERHRNFPQHRVGGTDLHRRFRVEGDARTVRPAKRRPVGSRAVDGGCREQTKQREWFHRWEKFVWLTLAERPAMGHPEMGDGLRRVRDRGARKRSLWSMKASEARHRFDRPARVTNNALAKAPSPLRSADAVQTLAALPRIPRTAALRAAVMSDALEWSTLLRVTDPRSAIVSPTALRASRSWWPTAKCAPTNGARANWPAARRA